MVSYSNLFWSHLSWSHSLIFLGLVSHDLVSHDLFSHGLVSHDLVSHLIPLVSLLALQLFSCRSGPVHQSLWYFWTAGGNGRNLLTRVLRKRYAWRKVVVVIVLLILLPHQRQSWEEKVDLWINDGMNDVLGYFAFDISHSRWTGWMTTSGALPTSLSRNI